MALKDEGKREGYDFGYSSGYDNGYDSGYDSGLDEGIGLGIEQKQIEMVERMIDENINISIISTISGLAIEEIEKIKQNM